MQKTPSVLKRILLIEDEEDIITIIKNVLEKEGYIVNVAKDGETALSLAKKQKPDFIILDIVLGGSMNGYKVCWSLKNDVLTKDVPILILSARGRKEEIELAYKAKADFFLLKPFDPRELLKKIEEAI